MREEGEVIGCYGGEWPIINRTVGLIAFISSIQQQQISKQKHLYMCKIHSEFWCYNASISCQIRAPGCLIYGQSHSFMSLYEFWSWISQHSQCNASV